MAMGHLYRNSLEVNIQGGQLFSCNVLAESSGNDCPLNTYHLNKALIVIAKKLRKNERM